MRVLLDANILISYLLAPRRASPIAEVVRQGVLGRYTLLLPEVLPRELVQKTHAARYLAERITPAEVEELAAILSGVAEAIPEITTGIPAVTRDPKDDYLLAYAVVGRADYLVTGDRDLLVLQQVGEMRIVTAHEICLILEERQPPSPAPLVP